LSKKFMEVDPHDQHSLRGRVFKYIREEILNGRFKPGESLVETRLAEELGVSRTPVREAIRQLELEGLVVSIPNKGVFVQGISRQDIDDIYTIRHLIEGQAVRWAVERIEEEELKELEEIVELMEYYTRKKDYEEIAKLDTKFHDVIYDACKSKVLRHTLSSLHHYIQKARLYSLKVPHRALDTLQEHKAILNAIERHDPEAAEKLMVQHISRASTNLHSHKDEISDETEQ
jgi:DNA-binding GntR family transcriptional regulator